MFDLIIIGAGPAGITAGVYAARKGMNLLVLTKDIGGQTAWSGNIENYTGYQFVSGPDLTAKFEEHMKKYALTVKENEEVTGLEKKNAVISVKTDKGRYEAASVIVASGKRSRELGVPGEKQFKNRGLTYCATCDGPLFAGKAVAIIGGGNSALDAALQLMNIASRVYLVNISPALTGDAIMRKKVTKSDKVSVLNNTKVTAIEGKKMVGGIKIKAGGSGKEKVLAVQGVFVEIGLIPNSGFAGALDMNGQKEIKVNAYNETNVAGIFAAGDVTDVPEKQIIIAAGEGAKASLSAFRYLAQRK
jgi:alkyl hydroperoxide reductase subunit F